MSRASLFLSPSQRSCRVIPDTQQVHSPTEKTAVCSIGWTETFWYPFSKGYPMCEARSLLLGHTSGSHPLLHGHSAVCETRCGRTHLGAACSRNLPPCLHPICS